MSRVNAVLVLVSLVVWLPFVHPQNNPGKLDNVPAILVPEPVLGPPLPLIPLESPPLLIPVLEVIPPQLGDATAVERMLDFSLPVLLGETTREILSRPHHDYPAADIVVPVGTVVHAVSGGEVIMATPDDRGACGGTVQIRNDLGLWTYCHLSGILVNKGDVVVSGWDIALSGGKPGARGSGSASVPHVHISWQRNG